MSTSSVTRFRVKAPNEKGATRYYHYKFKEYDSENTLQDSVRRFHIYYEPTDSNFADIKISETEDSELLIQFMWYKSGHAYIDMFKRGLESLTEEKYKFLIENILQGNSHDSYILRFTLSRRSK